MDGWMDVCMHLYIYLQKLCHNCIATNVLVELIFQDHIDLKSAPFRDFFGIRDQFQD